MDVRPEAVPRPEWTPVPHAGCVGVEGQVLLRTPTLLLAMLRFAPGATIHEHDAPWEIDVVCLEGSGFVSIDGSSAPLRAGERIRWPAGHLHRLWTDGDAMLTLMVEHGPFAATDS